MSDKLTTSIAAVGCFGLVFFGTIIMQRIMHSDRSFVEAFLINLVTFCAAALFARKFLWK